MSTNKFYKYPPTFIVYFNNQSIAITTNIENNSVVL